MDTIRLYTFKPSMMNIKMNLLLYGQLDMSISVRQFNTKFQSHGVNNSMIPYAINR